MVKPGGADALLASMRVKPGDAPELDAHDPAAKLGLENKDQAQGLVRDLLVELNELHDRLWAEAERSVLLVLQGIDASGKDGTIRKVLSGLNPQGCQVAGFKAPSDNELAQDYLRRVHHLCPARGQLGVFNRSHYEDVVAARLIGAVSHEQCRLRYGHICEFERMLVEEGTTVVKVYLHISKEQQRIRFQERIDNPNKAWKFKAGDLDVRERWDEYRTTYEEVITRTSTDHAPWHVVPADRKWVRDFAVATLLVATFRRLDPRFPPPDPTFEGLVVT
ncbi:MAG: PPK2 family polyphosphate kinase [Acidimicrobiia bacterium]